jgi:hypothetical protein
MKTSVLGALLTIASGYAGGAWAWGGLGHRTIGAIAEQLLRPAARIAVAELLSDDLDKFEVPSGRHTLAAVSRSQGSAPVAERACTGPGTTSWSSRRCGRIGTGAHRPTSMLWRSRRRGWPAEPGRARRTAGHSNPMSWRAARHTTTLSSSAGECRRISCCWIATIRRAPQPSPASGCCSPARGSPVC